MSKPIKKVVLAYSGGLDTSVIIPWLKENYDNCEVIAVSGDVGQGTELDGLEEKALKTGASKLYIEDLKKEFVEDYIFPTLKAGAIYEGEYLLGTSIARPVIAKRIAEIAIAEGADAIAHGCTGKGNDQVRFELTIKALAPNMQIIAPWRTWEMKSREDEIAYAEAHDIPLKISRETNYSKDKNLWHLSHEGLELEDPANEPNWANSFLEMGVLPQDAPDVPAYVKIGFEKGVPVSLDGVKMDGVSLIEKLNAWAGPMAAASRTSWKTGWWASSAGAYTRPRAAASCTRPIRSWRPSAWIGIPCIIRSWSPPRWRSWSMTASGSPPSMRPWQPLWIRPRRPSPAK